MTQETEYLGYDKLEEVYRFHYFVTFRDGRVIQTTGHLDVPFSDVRNIVSFEKDYIEILRETDDEVNRTPIKECKNEYQG